MVTGPYLNLKQLTLCTVLIGLCLNNLRKTDSHRPRMIFIRVIEHFICARCSTEASRDLLIPCQIHKIPLTIHCCTKIQHLNQDTYERASDVQSSFASPLSLQTDLHTWFLFVLSAPEPLRWFYRLPLKYQSKLSWYVWGSNRCNRGVASFAASCVKRSPQVHQKLTVLRLIGSALLRTSCPLLRFRLWLNFTPVERVFPESDMELAVSQHCATNDLPPLSVTISMGKSTSMGDSSAISHMQSKRGTTYREFPSQLPSCHSPQGSCLGRLDCLP